MEAWKAEIERLKKRSAETLTGLIGLEFTRVEEGYVEGTLPVDQRTHQPYGLLHGGASVVLAETLGSVGSHLLVFEAGKAAVGIEVNCNHLRAATDGHVIGKASLEHRGGKLHVWQIVIETPEGKKVATSRLTVMIIPQPKG